MVFDICFVFCIDYLLCNIEIFFYCVLDILDSEIDIVFYYLVLSVVGGNCYVDFYKMKCFF